MKTTDEDYLFLEPDRLPLILRHYRVSLVGYGVFAVWVTAESRRAACELAERLWNDNRSALDWQDRGIEHIEIIDEYDEGCAG